MWVALSFMVYSFSSVIGAATYPGKERIFYDVFFTESERLLDLRVQPLIIKYSVFDLLF